MEYERCKVVVVVTDLRPSSVDWFVLSWFLELSKALARIRCPVSVPVRRPSCCEDTKTIHGSGNIMTLNTRLRPVHGIL